METYMEFLKQTNKQTEKENKKQQKIDLPYDPPTALVGIYLKDSKEMFIAIHVTIAKTWNQPSCRLDPRKCLC